MLNPDDLFNQNQFDHPKLRYWQALADRHGNPPTVEVVRPRDDLGFAPAQIAVTIRGPRGRPVKHGEPWEPQLALATVERGWRAPTAAKESVRFGLLLKTLFAQPQTRYGDGFFSSVLVDELRQSGFAHDAAIAELLRLIRVPSPLPSASRDDCAENIKAVLSRVAQMLRGHLKYPQEQAKLILVKSIAYFLDERFSITPGKMLGLYRE